LVGWWRDFGWLKLRSLLGMQPRVVTYPSLETDPEVQQEKEEYE
jgi:urea transport system permease protein